MSGPTIPMNHDALSDLLNDPLIVRLVTVINVTSQSILEVLEYGFTPSDIGRAMGKGVVEFDTSSGQQKVGKIDVIQPNFEMGDYYSELISRKVRLGRLGLLMLEIVEADLKEASRTSADLAAPTHEPDSLFNQTTVHI